MAEIPTPHTPGYSSLRPPAPGMQGMVSSAHPLATMAGVRILQRGGNATDAAVAVAAALNVTEPHMSGLAGVGWMLFHHAATGKGEVLNYSGCAPAAAKPGMFTLDELWAGILAPAVPGNLAGWLAALERYGTLPRAEVFADAIRIAAEGQPLTRHQHAMIDFCWKGKFRGMESFGAAFVPGGRIPLHGEILVQADLAETLEGVVADGADYLYRGPLGRQIIDYLATRGGMLTGADLEAYQPDWEETLEGSYRGRTLRTLRPNASAFQLLETMNLLEGFDVAALGPVSADFFHLTAEAGKVAVADRIRYCTDPRFGAMPLEGLVSGEFADRRRALIDMKQAAVSEGNRFAGPLPEGAVRPGDPGGPLWGMTTHFSVVDRQRNVVTCTQTNGMIFGSGVVVPGTGVVLNNGMHWFDWDKGSASANRVSPRKRFEMPLMPVQVLENGSPVLSMGTPGNYGIPHTTAQMLCHLYDFGADIQEAIESPRAKPGNGRKLEIENRIPVETRRELEERGHELIVYTDYSMEIGGVQGIVLDPLTGALAGGADPRRDGMAAGF